MTRCPKSVTLKLSMSRLWWELRVARDGLPYTLAQFQHYYSPSVAWAEWQDAAPFASGASQPQPAVEAHGASGAVQPAV